MHVYGIAVSCRLLLKHIRIRHRCVMQIGIDACTYKSLQYYLDSFTNNSEEKLQITLGPTLDCYSVFFYFIYQQLHMVELCLCFSYELCCYTDFLLLLNCNVCVCV